MKSAVEIHAAGAGILASVMVLTYNRNAYAVLALRQILKQNFARDALEVVLVDDGTEPVAPLIEPLSSARTCRSSAARTRCRTLRASTPSSSGCCGSSSARRSARSAARRASECARAARCHNADRRGPTAICIIPIATVVGALGLSEEARAGGGGGGEEGGEEGSDRRRRASLFAAVTRSKTSRPRRGRASPSSRSRTSLRPVPRQRAGVDRTGPRRCAEVPPHLQPELATTSSCPFICSNCDDVKVSIHRAAGRRRR